VKEIRDKEKPITFGLMAKYYIHRLWRITPPYMLVLFFSVALSRYLGNGPLYPKDGFEINYCKNSWWTNLLVCFFFIFKSVILKAVYLFLNF
jgi:peptidoglycan/LPS O-acetylase OafA/YrhL